ncbi:hypothetical protein [Mastigocladopsis repens]|uniref:hypothetical protein n=1 Tax=Mastigocladopsis repens TaxID=221287 RepID=UPI001E646090|nr:hypothetical protein [Mastigocladopsis repens]
MTLGFHISIKRNHIYSVGLGWCHKANIPIREKRAIPIAVAIADSLPTHSSTDSAPPRVISCTAAMARERLPEAIARAPNYQHYPYQGCVVGPIVNSFTFVSSGWSIANATTLATRSGEMPYCSYNSVIFSATSWLVI